MAVIIGFARFWYLNAHKLQRQYDNIILFWILESYRLDAQLPPLMFLKPPAVILDLAWNIFQITNRVEKSLRWGGGATLVMMDDWKERKGEEEGGRWQLWQLQTESTPKFKSEDWTRCPGPVTAVVCSPLSIWIRIMFLPLFFRPTVASRKCWPWARFNIICVRNERKPNVWSSSCSQMLDSEFNSVMDLFSLLFRTFFANQTPDVFYPLVNYILDSPYFQGNLICYISLMNKAWLYINANNCSFVRANNFCTVGCHRGSSVLTTG